MFNYHSIVQRILNCFNKDELKVYKSLNSFDCLHLASMGHNDTEGYQIFTPEFIVKQMCDAIEDDILDFSINILEPTSGDGAFTVYILQKRLEKAYKEGNFELNSLKALSTLYSIEMDKELIEKQRNNIFTVFYLFIKEHNIQTNDGYLDLIKCIITKNYLWAMFNVDRDTQTMARFNNEVDLAFAMPNAEKNKEDDKYLLMPVWEINESNITLREEGVEYGG